MAFVIRRFLNYSAKKTLPNGPIIVLYLCIASRIKCSSSTHRHTSRMQSLFPHFGNKSWTVIKLCRFWSTKDRKQVMKMMNNRNTCTREGKWKMVILISHLIRSDYEEWKVGHSKINMQPFKEFTWIYQNFSSCLHKYRFYFKCSITWLLHHYQRMGRFCFGKNATFLGNTSCSVSSIVCLQ